MTSNNLKVVLAALVLGSGCSQIIGLSDYDIDPSLDDPKGSGGDNTGQGGDRGQGADAGQAGDPGRGGSASGSGGTSAAGEAGMGGSEPEGGSAPIAGASAGGVGGESGGAAGQGQGGAGSTLIPCTTADCCVAADGTAVGEELLGDGGFELGTVGDGNPYWTQRTTTASLELINVEGNGWVPRTGDYFVYLSGIAEEESVLWSEDVTIPEDTGWLEFTGYRRFQIDLADVDNTDYAMINFYGYEAGSQDESLFEWGEPSLWRNGWGATANWARFTTSWDATPHRGTIRYLSFLGYSDSYPETGEATASSYLYDDLSLKAFRCYE